MKEVEPKQLRDNPALIAGFLSRAFETDDFPTILGALRDALRAQNVSAVSRATGLRRDRLYKTFDGEINPDFSRILKLLEGLGVQLTVKERTIALPKPSLPKLGRPPNVSKG
jgi:probable addiction module antidote protein